MKIQNTSTTSSNQLIQSTQKSDQYDSHTPLSTQKKVYTLARTFQFMPHCVATFHCCEMINTRMKQIEHRLNEILNPGYTKETLIRILSKKFPNLTSHERLGMNVDLEIIWNGLDIKDKPSPRIPISYVSKKTLQLSWHSFWENCWNNLLKDDLKDAALVSSSLKIDSPPVELKNRAKNREEKLKNESFSSRFTKSPYLQYVFLNSIKVSFPLNFLEQFVRILLDVDFALTDDLLTPELGPRVLDYLESHKVDFNLEISPATFVERMLFQCVPNYDSVLKNEKKKINKFLPSYNKVYQILSNELIRTNLDLESYVTNLLLNAKLSKHTTLYSLLMEQETIRSNLAVDALLEEESKNKQSPCGKKGKTRSHRPLQSRAPSKEELPLKIAKSRKNSVQTENKKPVVRIEPSKGERWRGVPTRSIDLPKPKRRLPNLESILSLKKIKVADRVRRWMGAPVNSVRSFPDLNAEGKERYKHVNDAGVALQILQHDPTSVLQLLQDSSFRRNYLNETSKGFLAAVNVNIGTLQSSKTIASIGLSSDQSLLYHFFIHPEKELSNLENVNRNLLQVFFGENPEGTSSWTDEEQIFSTNSQNSVEYRYKESTGGDLSPIVVSYNATDPLKIGEKIPATLQFFPLDQILT